jgi:hypothetical protein
MQLPQGAKAPPVAVHRGPTPTLASATLSKALTSVDSRIVEVLLQDEVEVDEARLEIDLLGALRRTLASQVQDLPQDIVLLTSVIEYAEDAQLAVSQLRAGGEHRIDRLLAHAGELTAQLSAVGRPVADIKQQLKGARKTLAGPRPHLDQAMRDVVRVFAGLQDELERHLSRARGALFDDLLAP